MRAAQTPGPASSVHSLIIQKGDDWTETRGKRRPICSRQLLCRSHLRCHLLLEVPERQLRPYSTHVNTSMHTHTHAHRLAHVTCVHAYMYTHAPVCTHLTVGIPEYCPQALLSCYLFSFHKGRGPVCFSPFLNGCLVLVLHAFLGTTQPSLKICCMHPQYIGEDFRKSRRKCN